MPEKTLGYLMLAHMEEEVLEHLSEPYPLGGRGPGGCEGEMPAKKLHRPKG